MKIHAIAPLPVGLVFFRDPSPRLAVVVKMTLRILEQKPFGLILHGSQRPILSAAIPSASGAAGEVIRASDLVPRKAKVDLTVTGSAYAAEPRATIPVEIAIGRGFKKRVIVVGRSPSVSLPLSDAFLHAEPPGIAALGARAVPAPSLSQARSEREAWWSAVWTDLAEGDAGEAFQSAPSDQRLVEPVLPGTRLALMHLIRGVTSATWTLPMIVPYAVLFDAGLPISEAKGLDLRCDTVHIDTSINVIELVYRGDVALEGYRVRPSLAVGVASGTGLPLVQEIERGIVAAPTIEPSQLKLATSVERGNDPQTAPRAGTVRMPSAGGAHRATLPFVDPRTVGKAVNPPRTGTVTAKVERDDVLPALPFVPTSSRSPASDARVDRPALQTEETPSLDAPPPGRAPYVPFPSRLRSEDTGTMQLAPPAPDLPFAPTAEPSPPLEDAISFDDAPTNLGADDLDDPETLPPGPSDTIPPDSDQRATIPPLDDLPEVALTPARRDREAGETTQTISLAELRSAAAIMPFRSVEADDTEPLGTGTVRGQSPVAASRKPYRAPLETIVEDPSTPQPGASLDPSTGLPFSKAPSTVPPPPLSGDAAYPAMPPDKLVAISNVSGWETGTDSPAWSAVPGPPRAPAFTPIARPVARRADPLLAADVIARVRLADAADRPALLHSGGLSELGFALGVARWIDAIDDEVVEGRTERLAEILSALHDEELRKKALADAGERRPDARAR